MIEIPHRLTLAVQVAEILRRELRSGAFVQFLPGERDLCNRFQVSRMTLREALENLQREGLIEVSKGSRRRVTSKARERSSDSHARTVAVLGSVDYRALTPFMLFLIAHLQEHLRAAGCELEVHIHPRFVSAHWQKEMEELVRQRRVDCWVLLGVGRLLDPWFAKRCLRAVSVGSAEGKSLLPTLGVDYRAICRHAVGALTSRGHDRLALVLPRLGPAWDAPFVEGFLSGAPASAPDRDVQTKVTFHNGQVAGIASALRTLFRSASPPTGLLVARPKHVLTVMSWLSKSGIRVPEDVSLISLSFEAYLGNVLPSVAHYEFNWNAFAKRLFRIVTRLLNTGKVTAHETLLIAEFRDGGTLARRR